MQIAYWKTRDNKHWLKLYESRGPALWNLYCISEEGRKDFGNVHLGEALEYVRNEIIVYWPSKGIRQH